MNKNDNLSLLFDLSIIPFSRELFLVLKMTIWKWIATYTMIAIAIVAYHDDFKMEALQGFSEKFKILLDELVTYFKPVGFSDLMDRFSMELQQ